MKFRSFTSIWVVLFLLTVSKHSLAQSWTCCRPLPASQRVCDSLRSFRAAVLAASAATDTVNNSAINKLCNARIPDDTLRRILDTLKLYPMPVRIRFLRDIHGINNLPPTQVLNNRRSLSQFVDSLTTRHIRAWQWCDTARTVTSTTGTMRLDWDVLKSIVNAQNNVPALNALFINAEDKYFRVLRTFRGDCNTCDTAITDPRNNLPTISAYLDTLLAFATKYALPAKVAGFDIFIQQEASATWLTKPDGAYHLMRDLAKTSYPRTSVLEFEGTIASRMPVPAGGYQCAGCSYDLRMNNDTLVDYKSYGASTGFTPSTVNQFKQYLQFWLPNAANPTNPNAVPQRTFQYVFNGDKLDSTVARQKFYNLLRNDSTYFNINPAFFNRYTVLIGGRSTAINITNFRIFIDSIDNRHQLFNFVIIKP